MARGWVYRPPKAILGQAGLSHTPGWHSLAPLPGTLTSADPHPVLSLLCPVTSPAPFSPGVWFRGHGRSLCFCLVCRDEGVGPGLDLVGGSHTSDSTSDQATHTFVRPLP